MTLIFKVNALIECLTDTLESINLILVGRAFINSTHKITDSLLCIHYNGESQLL